MLDLILALAAVATGQNADPLAPARQGKIQCVVPNIEKKLCGAISTYTMRSDGSFDSVTTTMLAPTPLITMQTRVPGTVEKGSVCSPVRKADYEAATFQMDGAPMDEAMASGTKAQVVAALASMDGKKACGTDKPEGDLILAQITLDGVAHPELNQRYIWVDPADGYKIGQ